MNPELRDRLTTALERPHRLGMIGGELDAQLAHCASCARVLAGVVGDRLAGSAWSAVDLGTGGGIPGVALATIFPDAHWTLVEIRTSRATEVERALLVAGTSAEVLTEPAQELGHDAGHRERYNIVVARSFGPPSMTAECAAGLLEVGGALIVSEPPDGVAPTERWPNHALDALGLGPAKMHHDEHHGFAVIMKHAALDNTLPRRSAKSLRRWPRFT